MSNVTAPQAFDLTSALQAFPFQTLVTEDVNDASVLGGYISDNVISFSIYNGGAAQYFWDFGDGNTDTTSAPNTTHTYAGDGTYTVSVLVGIGGVTLTSFITTFTGGVTTEAENHWAVWFKYTPGLGETTFGLLAYAESGGNYRPETTIWLAPDTAPVQYLPTELEAGHDTPMLVPCTPGVTYWIRVEADSFSVLPFADLKLLVSRMPGDIGDIGSIFIPNDFGDSRPASVLSSSDGVTLQMRGTVNGEEASILPTGEFAIINDDDTDDPLAVVIYSPQFVELHRIFPFPDEAGINSISNNNVDTFYVSHRKTGEAFTTVKTVGLDGSIGGTSWVLPIVATTIAVNQAETILYYSNGAAGGPVGGTPNPINRWDLVNDIALSDLCPTVTDHYVGADLFVMADGNILAMYGDDGANDYFARLMDTSGVTIRDYPYTPITTMFAGPRMALANDDPDSFWVWSSSAVGFQEYNSRFVHFQTSDASEIANFDRPVFENSLAPAGGGNDGDLPVFGNTFSCPILILRVALASPYTATLIVNKVTVPAGVDQDFTINAGGGLTPSSFTLRDQEGRTFTPEFGTYSIEEETIVGFTTEYEVSNSDPIDAIEIEPGETVTVTITNTLLPRVYSGIYKIVPGKTNDTLWTSFDPEETIDVKIPDPFAKTAMIGS